MVLVDGGERIEIELTSHEERPTGRRRDPERWARASDDDDRPDGETSGDGPVGRRRQVAMGVMVGVIALLLGWLLGRSSAPADVAAPAREATTSTAVEVVVGDTIAAVDVDEFLSEGDASGDQPVEDRPFTPIVERGATTTTGSRRPTTIPIAVDERLLGTPLRLVGVEYSAALVEVDLERGTITDFGVRPPVFDGSGLVAGDDWVMATGVTSPTARVVRTDGTESVFELGESWAVLPVPGTNMVWSAAGSPDAAMVFRRTDLSQGVEVPGEIEVPFGSWPVAVDPATGGLIVQVAGRLFSLGLDGVERIGTGELIAASRDQLIVRDCDDLLVCALWTIDRSTGDASQVTVDDPATGAWQPLFGWSVPTGTEFSPDGRHVVLQRSSWRTSELGVLDLASGEFVSLTRDTFPPAVVWTPDSRHLLYLDGDGQLRAREVATGDDFPVFTEVQRWNGAAARPVSAPADQLVQP
jgi:hypothetical protein